jgi:hypothetical protein
MMVEIENGITHYLPRSVVGYITTAIDGIEPCINLGQGLIIEEEVGHVAAFAQCVHMGMLNKKQVVSCDHLFFGRFRTIIKFRLYGAIEMNLLQIPAGFIIHAA